MAETVKIFAPLARPSEKFLAGSLSLNDVVDYAVPGIRILSTYKGGKYAYMSGTSMATPHMTGCYY
jgi:hypothetical protein